MFRVDLYFSSNNSTNPFSFYSTKKNRFFCERFMMHIFLFTWRLHWRDKTVFLIQLVELIVCRCSHDHWFSIWILNWGNCSVDFPCILRLISLKSLASQMVLMVNKHVVPFQSSKGMIIITQLDFMLWLSFHGWVISTYVMRIIWCWCLPILCKGFVSCWFYEGLPKKSITSLANFFEIFFR